MVDKTIAEDEYMKKFLRYIPLIIIISLFIIAIASEVEQHFKIDQLRMHRISLEAFVEHHKILGLIVYSLVYILVVSLSIPGASFLTIVGGFLFGQFLGTVIVVLSASFGATILFLSVRLAADEWLQARAGVWLKRMQQGFKENAISYSLTLRLIPLFPFVAVNLVSAILKVPLRIFFSTTIIGIIPGSFVYVSLGVALQEVIQSPDLKLDLILNPKVLLALAGLGILTLLPVVYKKFKHKRLD